MPVSSSIGNSVKAWARFNGGTVGINPPIDGSNIASIERTGAGEYAVLFQKPLASANYCVSILGSQPTSNRLSGVGTVNGFNFSTWNSFTGGMDAGYVVFSVIQNP